MFIVFNNSDLTEGRGPMKIVGVFDNEHAALTALNVLPTVMGVGKPGDAGEIFEVPLNLVFNNIYDFRRFSGYDRKWHDSERTKRYNEYLKLKREFE